MHPHDLEPARAGYRLPLLVLVSRRLDHVVIAGRPDEDLLYARLRELGAHPVADGTAR